MSSQNNQLSKNVNPIGSGSEAHALCTVTEPHKDVPQNSNYVDRGQQSLGKCTYYISPYIM